MLKQANELGGSVRKRGQSTVTVFWKLDEKEDQDREPGVEETQRRFLLRYYPVFNLEKCDLPRGVIDKLPKIETHEHDPIDAVELIIANMPQRPAIAARGIEGLLRLDNRPRNDATDRTVYIVRRILRDASARARALCRVPSYAVLSYADSEPCATGAAYRHNPRGVAPRDLPILPGSCPAR